MRRVLVLTGGRSRSPPGITSNLSETALESRCGGEGGVCTYDAHHHAHFHRRSALPDLSKVDRVNRRPCAPPLCRCPAKLARNLRILRIEVPAARLALPLESTRSDHIRGNKQSQVYRRGSALGLPCVYHVSLHAAALADRAQISAGHRTGVRRCDEPKNLEDCDGPAEWTRPDVIVQVVLDVSIRSRGRRKQARGSAQLSLYQVVKDFTRELTGGRGSPGA